MLLEDRELFHCDSLSQVKGRVQGVDVMEALSTWGAWGAKEHLNVANMQIVKQICNSTFSLHHRAEGLE